MPIFSIWPPSDRFSHALLSVIPTPVISRISAENPGTPDGFFCGFPIQKPSLMLRSVISADRVGSDPNPMCGDAAAPDIAIAVARSTGLPLVHQFFVRE